MRKAYKEYKATGIQWLPKIPRHWALRRNKNIFTEHSEVVGSNSNEYDLLSLTLGGVIRRDLNAGGKFSATYDKYKIVKKGYMIFCLFDIDETPRTVGLSEYNGMITGAYTIMEINNINPLYVYFYYLSLDNNKLLKPLYTGLRKTIKANVFQSVKLPVPPREEQEQIVRFLDWKVSSINKLISIKQQEITELMELKKATISDAVTHGLDKTVPMKDSNIPWLGKIPNTWNAIKIKWLFKETNERNIHNNAELLSFSRNRGLVSFADITKKQPSALDLTNYKLVHPGQLLENRMQAWSGMFICATRSGCVSPDYSVFSPQAKRYVNTLFYEYVFRNSLQVEQFANASRGIGTGFNRLYTPEFGAIYTIYPPREEQEQIVRFLDARCAEIDRLIAAKQAQITNLHDLKSSLIADVVTGQIDVRDVTIPNYETVQEHADEAPDTVENPLEADKEV